MSHLSHAVLRAPLRGWALLGVLGVLGVSLLTLFWATAALAEPEPLRIGSKRFTESYILAEVLAQTVQAGSVGSRVEIKQGLGNTAIVYAALQAGSIDLYPEYLGTVNREILKNSGPTDLATLRAQLKPLGLGLDIALGFNNGYALAVQADLAQRLGLTKLSDLAHQPGLRLGLSNEFIGRADGWPGLAQRYGLKHKPQGLDHGLAFEAIAAGQVDVIDIYTTDAKIAQQGLRLLQDDGAYFARYDAMLLYRLDLPQRHPEAWAKLHSLRGRIDEAAMIRMNAQAELQGQGFAAIAKEFLAAGPAPSALPASTVSTNSYWVKLTGPDLARLTWQHLSLVLGSVGLAALLGIPLATWVAPHSRLRGLVLGATGLAQTVPALALLAVLISAFNQIGTLPALLALTLYALLPIMRNTCTGLAEVPAGLRLAGMAMGFTTWQRLRLIDLPLAAPVILAGLRTATSIAVGTATIAAFIGAGGYGERIVTGLALNDRGLLLAGALPAALLALAFEGLFALLARQLRRPDQADFLAAPR
ncbi:glycine betaine ABC transporter substrate-binding protein [Roseateles sp. PN1]|uniref:glycine betaine ABC transporter substrate-binding protein n=1 Tax=Roseateles sp. PN1 TaxID=3137372 RepID=UPI003138B5EB